MDKFNAEVFISVAELGSYRKAAEALNYTQAGIKYIIDAMEEEAGLKFFAREYGGVTLTENGKDILPWVRQLKGSQYALESRIGELVKLNSGKIRVMCFNSLLVYWLPEVIGRFHEKYPSIEIDLVACDRFSEMEDAVYRREADLGFFLLPTEKTLDTRLITEEPMLAAFSPDHPLAEKSTVSLNDLSGFTYIGPPLEYDPGMQKFFEEGRMQPKIGFSTENDNAALALASKGLGYCVYPKFMLDKAPFDLKTAEFTKPLRWSFAIGTRSLETCSAAAKAFWDCTLEYAKEKSAEFGL